ncbi:antitoxin component YwqK of YwqJK toxin-antitoxin module [Pseudomonas sp. JUb42]|uniref:toxin-antitoxin system YwqK family antitoxin n=1 Tax=Pseudomonas sp. JUb42 TaxID=2940611 RepID=UPI002169B24D|nr:toxin-antitoxin system YwqK family antitoxin [Pseudomonas sp. JUb42]MCS3472596.1 antitoxin component YwqK of YwqJK toxin-antitoxin module [Pseudomonas sp. JUb42]
MNLLYLALLSFLLTLIGGCSQNELDFKNMQISNGKIFKKSEDTPFSGTAYNLPESVISMAANFNDFLVSYNNIMDKTKARENTIYGRHLICTSEVKKGYLSGLTICYIPNTNVKRYTAEYTSGLLNGDINVYAADGKTQLAHAQFTNDLIDGDIKVYGPHSGKLIAEYHSTNGKADGSQTTWDENTGQMTSNVVAKNGLNVGLMRLWSREGVLTGEVPFSNGLKSGLVKTWFDNGKPMSVVMMKDGYRDGPSQSWDEKGVLISSGTYKREIWYPNQQPATSPSLSNSNCPDKWIDAFHRTNGEDALITTEQIDEWESWCAEGKLPN